MVTMKKKQAIKTIGRFDSECKSGHLRVFIMHSDTVESPWRDDEHQASLEKSSYAIPSTVFPFIRP